MLLFIFYYATFTVYFFSSIEETVDFARIGKIGKLSSFRSKISAEKWWEAEKCGKKQLKSA
jgi:hypothetical protein